MNQTPPLITQTPAESQSPSQNRQARSCAEESVTAAARKLGGLKKELFHGRRREQRTWTGFVDGSRCWNGRKVIMPDGRVVELQSAYRGEALVLIPTPGNETEKLRYRIPTTELRIFKLAEAVELGRRKLGIVERPSPKKAAAARLNGTRPARPGHRKRGRPRKNTPPWTRFVLKTLKPPRNQSMNSLMAWMVAQRAEVDQCVLVAAEADKAQRCRQAAINGSGS